MQIEINEVYVNNKGKQIQVESYNEDTGDYTLYSDVSGIICIPEYTLECFLKGYHRASDEDQNNL